MKIKSFCSLILSHVVFFIFGTILFILLFRTGLFQSLVLFYRGIILLIISCVFMCFLMISYKRSIFGRVFTYKDIVLSAVLIFCLNLVFFTHLPVTADRSISVFLLGSINRYQEKGLRKNEIVKIFIQKYLYEYGAMDKRINEQIVSKNIVRKNNAYEITKQGQLLIKIYSIIADLFNIDKKIIFP